MLNQRIDIVDAPLPLLLSMPGDTWHLIIKIEKLSDDEFCCSCLRQSDNSIEEYTQDIHETPFHVGDGIWELSYGSELVTLLDSSLNDHPAKQLWQQWYKK